MTALETVLQETGLGMLSFTCAWEDTSCVTELKVVVGLITKQTREKALLTAPLPPCIHPPHKATCQLSLSTASTLA